MGCDDFTSKESCGGGLRLSSGGTFITPVKTPRGVLAPWVEIVFVSTATQEEHKIISVGNDSATTAVPKNAAVIKSFEFGQDDGFSASLTIHDQQGGAFETFMKHLFNEWDSDEGVIASQYTIRFQFGWTRTHCSGEIGPLSSPCFHATVYSTETSFMEGKFIATINAGGTSEKMFEGSSEETQGETGDQGMHLKDAIVNLMTNTDLPGPHVKEVNFVKFTVSNDGKVKTEPCPFEDYDDDPEKGVKGSWHSNSLDKIHTILTWLAEWPAEDGYSWTISFDASIPGERLVIAQVAAPKCAAVTAAQWAKYCIGIYVVNGGNDSSVIEFNPKINWDFALFASTGGNAGENTTVPFIDEEGNPTSKNKGLVDCFALSKSQTRGAGQSTAFPVSTQVMDIYGEEAGDKSYNAIMNFHKANERELLHKDIEADLVIVGDPTLVNPWMMRQKAIGIIFINPFFISTENNGLKEWLATPLRNKTLTNGAWKIQKINHKISLGSYTTTINLKLSTGDPAEPLGLWTPSGLWAPTV